MFAWRACKNGLPCFLNLKRKGVEVEGKCVLDEDLSHAVFHYPTIRSLWNTFLPCMQNVPQYQSFVELAGWVRNRGKENELSKFFLIAWGLWGKHNKKLYEEANINPIAGGID